MNQLTQQLKSGIMEILEVPFPTLAKGQILVRNHYSVISAGTEGRTVSDARKSYIQKAKSRQKEVKQVINQVKSNGLIPTYKLVMNKLEAPASLGYSCAGEVIAVGEGVIDFQVGDFVACGGQGAFHADVVTVYEKLCVKVSSVVDMKQAAFSTIASIAIQGIRQADLQFGENCVIIGMGLIGQLTYKILEASGIRAIGIDISEEQIEICIKKGMKLVFNRKQPGLEDEILKLTDGFGPDSVIITAGSSSLDPIEFAGTIARKKGKVVIVGAVPTGFSRAAYYKKELDLRMSSSYGPGRYDSNYEEKGIDYPIGYVRWTENRNMQSFVRLLSDKKLDISDLITHTFPLIEAHQAYDLILEKSEPFTGILIEYDTEVELKRQINYKESKVGANEPNVGFIGAGSFAQGTLLPNLKNNRCNFLSIATAQGNESVYVAKKYGFKNCYENGLDVINDTKVNTVFIVTRHNSHAQFVSKAIEAGKTNIFVEKPLAMNYDELTKIKELYDSLEKKPRVMVGFNRRFSPYIQKAKKTFRDDQQKAIVIRVNAGQLPSDHWVNDPDIGGGRIIGEACHFIDLAMYLAGSRIISINTEAINSPNIINNTVVMNLSFENGSIANISYFSNGSKQLPKEYIEVFCGGTVAKIEDFNKMEILSNSVNKIKFNKQDKGHGEELKQFIDAIHTGKPAPISFEDCFHSTYVTLKAIESMKSKRRIEI
jgi:predicted dehydrogenase/threonine dehydrogenase-like Zn-dependent dehydrogenase